MANIGQVYYNVLDYNNEGIRDGNADIYTDIVAQIGASQFNKVGVQAPPGAKMILNKTKTIMIGRTGIYELDEDIAITNMYFVRPWKYTKDEEQSQQKIEEGGQLMQQAEEQRETALQALHESFPSVPEPDSENYQTYWDTYNNIQSAYEEKYKQGLSLYNQGRNGIYVLPNPDNPDDPENFTELYNVIIDFIYE